MSSLLGGCNLLRFAAPVPSWNFLDFSQVRAQMSEARGRLDRARAACDFMELWRISGGRS